MMESLVWWAISLLFVVALILGLALLVKRFAMPGAGRAPIFRKAAERRLEVIESLPVDHKSRLMLIRRDDINHLILLGPEGDLVVETGITPPPPLSPTVKSKPASQDYRSPDYGADPRSYPMKDPSSMKGAGPDDSASDGGGD